MTNRLVTYKKNDMVLTIISIWFGSIAIGAAGALAAFSNRWVTVLALNVAAGIFAVALLSRLQGDFAITLFQAGDAYVWLTMLAPLFMWGIMLAGAAMAQWKHRGDTFLA